MTIELMIAIGSGVVAISSGIFAYLAQTRVVKIQHELAVQHEETERVRLVSKYREPLVRAAADLQRRLWAIVRKGFLATLQARGTEDEKRYAVEHTLFVVAEYFGWVEIIRREVQSLDLGRIETWWELNSLLEAVSTAFLVGEPGRTFRLFRGEQRAIGELMLTARPSGDHRVFDLIGFVEFSNRLQNPEFRRWFRNLEASIAAIALEVEFDVQRLILVQHALVDLIDFLDPDALRLARDHRLKIDG